jgi:hypothetical protein
MHAVVVRLYWCGGRRNASEAGQDRAAPTGRRDKKIAGSVLVVRLRGPPLQAPQFQKMAGNEKWRKMRRDKSVLFEAVVTSLRKPLVE